mmetsp:Transcript_4985/g.14585  ORF Transcript_4985/g.14585 Transcript_4985/m.14585 type:complete len:222 (-) Transcript_4985:493-1158(-)
MIRGAGSFVRQFMQLSSEPVRGTLGTSCKSSRHSTSCARPCRSLCCRLTMRLMLMAVAKICEQILLLRMRLPFRLIRRSPLSRARCGMSSATRMRSSSPRLLGGTGWKTSPNLCLCELRCMLSLNSPTVSSMMAARVTESSTPPTAPLECSLGTDWLRCSTKSMTFAPSSISRHSSTLCGTLWFTVTTWSPLPMPRCGRSSAMVIAHSLLSRVSEASKATP